MFIYGICGVGLMLLIGYTGLAILGHAAFLGIGAYAHTYFLQHGVPWVASVAIWPRCSRPRAASRSACRPSA